MSTDPGKVPHGEPLAYFLTWTTYGTWLPGDERGWVARPGEFRLADQARESASRLKMTEKPSLLDAVQRTLVEETIADHCRLRGWLLHAVSCRTNHVHVVVSASGISPDEVMDQLKAWCTRRLKQQAAALGSRGRSKWWTQGGSRRWINDEHGLAAAVEYVHEAQDRPRPAEPG